MSSQNFQETVSYFTPDQKEEKIAEFLRLSVLYKAYTSSLTNSVLEKIEQTIEQNLDDPTSKYLDETLKQADYELATKIIQDEKIGRSLVLTPDGMNQKRHAGYINASIILYAVLNVGVLLAVVLIIFQK